MPHSPVFSVLSRLVRAAHHPAARGMSDAALVEHLRREQDAPPGASMPRRAFLGAAAGGVAALATAGRALGAPPTRPNPRIAIIGGGLAGLVCADALRRKGLVATIYEAGDRVGGRCFSLRGFFPGQTAELGGEFIDTTHHTMRSYAVEFGLAREDVRRFPGEVFYEFGGVRYPEEDVVAEYRALVPRMRADLQTLSGEPTFFSKTPADIALDNVSLREWLDTRAADLPLIRRVLDVAYTIEYGREAAEQSCLNLLLFIHADRRRKFTPFGVFSDERFHITGGNDAIAMRIAQRLPGPVNLGARLMRLARRASGEYEMVFAGGQTLAADFVVVTVPFTVLRTLDLDPSLGLSADKVHAINTLGYGDNSKTMVGFEGRPWEAVGCDGAVYSDRPNLQATWQTNPSLSGATSIITDYSGGVRGLTLGAVPLQTQAAQFLADFDAVVPGAAAAASRPTPGTLRAARMHWPTEPLSRGSYTSYTPGQFTGVAGLEAQAAGRLKFAGEHADSFYSWQGFMEGACLSGLRAAGEILAELK